MNHKDQITIGIVGAGWIAAQAHVPSFLDLEGVKCAAVFDTDQKKAIQLAKQVGGLPYDRLTQFEDMPVDGVVICTPTSSHYELASYFLKRGIHVLCEKR